MENGRNGLHKRVSRRPSDCKRGTKACFGTVWAIYSWILSEIKHRFLFCLTINVDFVAFKAMQLCTDVCFRKALCYKGEHTQSQGTLYQLTFYIYRCTANCKPQGGNYNDKAQALIHVRRRRVYIKFTNTIALSSSFPHKIITRNTRVTSCKAFWKVLYKKNPTKMATHMSDLLMIGRHTSLIHHLSLFCYAVHYCSLEQYGIWNWIHGKISVLFHCHEPELEPIQSHSQSYGLQSWMCWMQISHFVSEQTLYWWRNLAMGQFAFSVCLIHDVITL